MIEQSNENAEVRIQELEKRKWELENEINLLKTGKSPIVFDDTEIERFYDLNKVARESSRRILLMLQIGSIGNNIVSRIKCFHSS